VQARLSLATGDGSLRALIVPASLVLAPGQTGHAEVLLRPRRPQLLGRERQHEAQLRVRVPDGTTTARPVIFVQARALPLWAIALIVAILVAAVFAATQLQRRATVPAVEGAVDVASADRALRAAGLRLDPRLRSRTTAGPRPGTILDQIPDPGVRVERGERVTLLVAVGARRAVTPALDGHTPARAAVILRAAGLVAGPVLPDLAPRPAVVASQLPVAGAREPTGTAVTIFVRPLRAGEAPGANPAAGGEAKVPAIEGRSAAAYARAVAAAGLVPRVVLSVGTAAVGALVGVQPRPGLPVAAGEQIRLLVSAGVPQLAYDTGDVLRVFDPRRGRTVRELLVFGVRRGQPGRFGILRYRSSRPYSTNPSHWRGEPATNTSVRGRGAIAAAYSPSGASVALVTNVGLQRFQLLVTDADELRRPDSPSLPVRACEVAWRPDGRELTVVQSDGACGRAPARATCTPAFRPSCPPRSGPAARWPRSSRSRSPRPSRVPPS